MLESDDVSDLIEPPESIQYYGTVVVLDIESRLYFQRKTPGYPIEPYVGRLALIGGSWSTARDESPRDTIRRELDEELASPEWRDAILGHTLDFLVAFDFELPELQQDDSPFWARTFVFASRLEESPRDTAFSLNEGEAVLVEEPSELDEPLCWGHEHALAFYGARQGIDFPNLPVTESSARLVCREEPTSYDVFELDRLINNPSGDSPMEDTYELGDD